MREYEPQGRWTPWHVLAVLLVLGVLVGALGLIYRLTDNRATGTAPSESAGRPTATPSASASPQETPRATASPQSLTLPPAATQAPSASPSRSPSAPTARPTSAPTPPPPTASPAVVARPPVLLPARLAATTVTDRLRVRSEPGVGDDSVRYEPPLPRGTKFRIVEGPVYASDYWWYRIAAISARLDGGVDGGWVASADHDGTPWIGPARDACLDFQFGGTAITVGTFDELETAFIGTWAGCAWTPWTPPYWVTLEFRADGTYTSRAEVAPNREQYPALYYGMDDDSPDKRYQLHDLHDSGLGSGQIDIVFHGGSVNRDELRNIALMGDRVEFEFFHASVYGPLTYRLYLQSR